MTEEVIDQQNNDPVDPAATGDTPQLLTDEADGAGKPGEGGNPAAAGDEGAGDGTASGEGKEPLVPEAYADFSLPEGVSLDAKFLEKMTESFKGAGLTQEQAQAIISSQAEFVKAGEEASVAAFNQLVKGWVTEAKNDKEIGGEKFDENVQAARGALEKFGTPELKKLLNDYGIGSHPELIRAFTRIGKLLKEDQPGGGAPQQQQKDRAEILYG